MKEESLKSLAVIGRKFHELVGGSAVGASYTQAKAGEDAFKALMRSEGLVFDSVGEGYVSEAEYCRGVVVMLDVNSPLSDLAAFSERMKKYHVEKVTTELLTDPISRVRVEARGELTAHEVYDAIKALPVSTEITFLFGNHEDYTVSKFREQMQGLQNVEPFRTARVV